MKRSEILDLICEEIYLEVDDINMMQADALAEAILAIVERKGMLPPPVTKIESRQVWEEHNEFPGGGLLINKDHEITKFEWEPES